MFGEIIERKRLTIPKLEATIYELRGQAISSDEYGERVAGWLSERERRISEVDDEIRELEEKLASIRERLNRPRAGRPANHLAQYCSQVLGPCDREDALPQVKYVRIPVNPESRALGDDLMRNPGRVADREVRLEDHPHQQIDLLDGPASDCALL